MENIKVNFKPSVNKILFKRDKKEEKTTSGLYLPPQAIEETIAVKGTVLAVGDRDGDHTVEYFPGDRILVTKFGGANMEFTTNHGKEELTIIDQVEILGKITSEGFMVEYPENN